jgi:N-carbamoyl-L-amino-acid hydrolase
MNARRDAGLGAAALMLAVRDTVTQEFPGCVANVGDVQIEPGAFNVVPALAQVKLEGRSLDGDELDMLSARLTGLAQSEAERWNLDVDIRRVGLWAPAPTHERARRAFADAAARLGLSSMEMPSGAGHDAQVMAHDAQVMSKVTTSGMVFVPSDDGISHHPDEHTGMADCINGANVLLGAAVELARVL